MSALFVMAGGGTGGHVVPGLAVARELRSRGHDVTFIGVERGLEAKLVPPEKFPIEWIEIGGFNRVGLRQKLETLAELPFSVWQSARILDRLKPAAVFSMGGYVAGPVLLASLWKKIPVVVMEPNAVPGLTHRRFARFVSRALVSFPETASCFPPGRAELTGLPIREEFFAVPPKPVPEEQLTILITGGSQGSRTLNRAVEESWPLWEKGTVRLIHQTGSTMYEKIAAGFQSTGLEGEVVPFISDMPRAYAEADIVVGRSGMGTVSEIAAAGKPSILVPFPGASDQHQLKNAQALEKLGAARVVLDHEMNGARLFEEISQLATKAGCLENMGQSARLFAKRGAAQKAADVLGTFIVDRVRESRNNTI